VSKIALGRKCGHRLGGFCFWPRCECKSQSLMQLEALSRVKDAGDGAYGLALAINSVCLSFHVGAGFCII
jgi:hypothetical protein